MRGLKEIMLEKCTHCGCLHYRADPCKKATAKDVGLAHRVERRSPKPKASGSSPETYAIAGSSNGRTAPFDGVNAGSTPAPASKPRGRPRIHADRKAYKAEHERKRRAAQKEAK